MPIVTILKESFVESGDIWGVGTLCGCFSVYLLYFIYPQPENP